MDFLTIFGGAITFGSALGATIAGFFAYRQKSLVTLLRESNKDYQDRVKQLEDERDELKRRLDNLTRMVDELKRQKTAPLENLTQLMIKQNENIVEQLASVAKAVASIPKDLQELQAITMRSGRRKKDKNE